MKVDEHEIELSSQDKVFYEEAGIKKGDVIKYYERIFDTFHLHVKDRPVTLRRYPNGIDGQSFYQKSISDYFPDWINGIEIKKEDGDTNQMPLIDKASTLVYLANQAALEYHIFLSKKDEIARPDKLIFDLDPPASDFSMAKKGALALKDRLEKQEGLSSFVMTTGSTGLHVVVPVKPKYAFDRVRDYAELICSRLADDYPDDFTTEIRKNKRNERLFLDYTRNARAQHSIAPYSLRAIAGAPIATPLDWDELGQLQEGSRTFHIKNIFRRLSQKEDPWSDFFHHLQSLPMED